MNREQAGMDKQDILRNYNLNVRTKPVSFLYEKIKITPVFMANIFISGV